MKKYCQNCYHPLPYKAKFCAHCGQKASDGKVPVSDLMQQLWFRVLHLESRSLRVLWRLFIPGQVSLDYFSGKRKRYPPPVQFFFVIMFFFLLLVNHLIGDTGHIGFRESDEGFRIASNDTITPPVDLYRLGQRYAQMQRLRYTLDSLPPEYRTPAVRAALDSLFRRTGDGGSSELGAFFSADRDSLAARPPDSLSFSLGIRHLRVSVMDLFEHDADALIQKYRLTHWTDKMLMRQGIKSVREPKTLIKTYLGSLAWTLLVLVALMAGVLTLLHLRQRRYYVEHFIFLLHEHTAFFLILTLALLLANLTRFDLYIWGLVVCWFLLEPVLAMKRYYRQNWWITILKSTVFSVLYVICFTTLFIGGIIVVFFLF